MFAWYFISHLKILKASNSKLFYCDLVIISSKHFNSVLVRDYTVIQIKMA